MVVINNSNKCLAPPAKSHKTFLCTHGSQGLLSESIPGDGVWTELPTQSMSIWAEAPWELAGKPRQTRFWQQGPSVQLPGLACGPVWCRWKPEESALNATCRSGPGLLECQGNPPST